MKPFFAVQLNIMSSRYHPYSRPGQNSSDEETVTIPKSLFNKLMRATNNLLPEIDCQRDTEHIKRFRDFARHFFFDELCNVESKYFKSESAGAVKKTVIFETPTMFGRFQMDRDRVVNQKMDDCVRDLSRLWQQSCGYIVVEIETRWKDSVTDKTVCNLVIFSVRKDSHRKLSHSEVEQYLTTHSILKAQSGNKSFIY